MEFLIIFLLILLNGVFAMAEIAIVSARKSKLKQQASEGNKPAQAALDLANNPAKFLPTVQVGITLVGIFAGAFGGATIAEPLSGYFHLFPVIGKYSDAIALSIVVLTITYLSLIIGELVPKRLALSSPEKIAAVVARPMNMFAGITYPVVALLSKSTDWVLNVLGITAAPETPVSEEEVRTLLHEGARSGVFEVAEKDIVDRTLKLSDKKVSTMMKPRKEVIWLDINSTDDVLRSRLRKKPQSHFPVCRGSLEKVVGIVRSEDLLTDFLATKDMDLEKHLHKPLFIPENMDGLRVLELFKKSGIHMALVVDEYGTIQGLLSLTDVLEAIVGDIPTLEEAEEKEIIKREDGSYLVDGLISIDKFKDFFHIKEHIDEDTGSFNTIGGFVMSRIERIPISGDTFTAAGYIFEVVDMDGNRVDKILLTEIR